MVDGTNNETSNRSSFEKLRDKQIFDVSSRQEIYALLRELDEEQLQELLGIHAEAAARMLNDAARSRTARPGDADHLSNEDVERCWQQFVRDRGGSD